MMSSIPTARGRPRGGSSQRPAVVKGKSRANIPEDVIELTDSDNDDHTHSKKLSRDTQPGPSRSRNQLLPLASASTENMPSPNQRSAKPGKSERDEENNPPPRTSDPPPLRPDFAVEIEDVSMGQVTVEDPFQPEPEPQPMEPEQDTCSKMLAQVLEVVPDVQPDHAVELLSQQTNASPDEVVQAVVHALFEAPYPKVDRKGKRKAIDENEGQHKRARLDEPDYAKLDRPYTGGVYYSDLSMEQLMVDFPDIPKPHIRKTLYANKSLYAPTHLHFLAEKERGPPFSYIPKRIAYRPSTKGKLRALEDAEFNRERAWLLQKLKPKEAAIVVQEDEESGDDGIECGCCFSTYSFDKIIQCPDAHLFCSECMNSYAENLLGAHNININCMDQSGCKLPFPVSELRRFLPEKLLDLYEKVKQRKEIEAAGLEGLEECPFCDYKCVIENPDEKLFRCGNEDKCGAITCRQCKKMDHLPKSCKEMEEDRVLDGRHVIEEAMTRALMRNCPRCGKSFVKEDGCNKMTCPHCRTLSCYVCRKEVRGYDHFNQNAPGAPATATTSSNKTCPLWEPVETRHAAEVKAAAEKALEEYKRDNPDVSQSDIKVDIPSSPKRARNPVADGLGYGLAGMPRYNPYAAHPPIPPHPHVPVPHIANNIYRLPVNPLALLPHPYQPPAPPPVPVPAPAPLRRRTRARRVRG